MANLVSNFLTQHGQTLEQHGIRDSGLGLSPQRAIEFIDLLEEVGASLVALEVWRWYVAERGRHTYWSAWSSQRPKEDFRSAREFILRDELKASDLVTFTLGETSA
jgi:hypothetical protein